VNEPGYAPVAWILGFPASCESGTGVLLHTIFKRLSPGQPPSWGLRRTTNQRVARKQQPVPASGWRTQCGD